MVFHSWSFLFFLPICVSIYYILVKVKATNRTRNLFIIFSSLFFYSYGQIKYLPFLISSSIIDYLLGRKLALIPEKSPERHFFLSLSFFFNIGILVILKYGNWFYSQFDSLMCVFGKCGLLPPLQEMILPAGISFYTFQTLSYTFDVYRDKEQVENDFISYMSYVCFFPQLVAGPIERASTLIPQIKVNRAFPNKKTLSNALMYISWGLFKKIVFADNLGNLVNVASLSLAAGSGFIAVFAFSFQIYCDFSAYTDIAKGVAMIFGIKLRRNFLVPYSSRSPSEFWRRWHISLSEWIKDYLYIPLGGNKKGKTQNLLNLFLTMILAGMWHGSGEMFLIWGIYHGVILIIYRLIPINEILESSFPIFGKYYSGVLMYGLICFGWMMFMSKNFRQFLHYGYRSMTLFIEPFSPILLQLTYGLVLFSLPIIISEIIARKSNKEFTDILISQHSIFRVFFYFIVFYSIIFLGKREAYDFIYFQF